MFCVVLFRRDGIGFIAFHVGDNLHVARIYGILLKNLSIFCFKKMLKIITDFRLDNRSLRFLPAAIDGVLELSLGTMSMVILRSL
jgi:hypothetical protein